MLYLQKIQCDALNLHGFPFTLSKEKVVDDGVNGFNSRNGDKDTKRTHFENNCKQISQWNL